MLYIAQRGRLDAHHGRAEGLSALMLVDCPLDERMRIAVWFTPDPDPEAAAGSPGLSGSPADEDALRSFMEHFDLCGAKRS